MILFCPPELLAQAPYRARPVFSHTFDRPVLGPVFDQPQHLGVLLDNRFEGISSLTGLPRYGGEALGAVRRWRELAGGLLVEGRHLYFLNPSTGKTAFEYPLNCDPSGCQAQVLDADDGTVLLAGFGAVPSSVMPLAMPAGREVWGAGSWLETGPLAAGVLVPGGALLLLREDKGRLIQVDFGTRQVVRSVASPEPALPLRWWLAQGGAAFVGLGDEGERMVFLHADGRALAAGTQGVLPLHAWPGSGHWFGTQDSGRGLRFYSEAGALEGSLDCQMAPKLWYLDGKISLETLEVESPDGVMLLEPKAKGGSVVMLNPAGGKEIWRRDFPAAVEVAGLSASGVVLRSGGRVLVLAAGTGALLGILELPGVSGDLRGPLALADGRLAVASGALLMVLEKRDAGDLAQEFAAGLSSQGANEALQSFRAWEAFEQGFGAVAKMRASLVDGLMTRALGAPVNGEGQGETLAGLAYLCRPGSECGRRVAGLLTMLYFAGRWYPVDGAEASYFIDVLSSTSAELQTGTAAALFLDGRGDPEATLAFEALLPEGHPAVAQRDRVRLDQLVESVALALEAGELPVAVKLLKELSRTRALEDLLGQESEPLLDAKSVDLLPPELLPQRLPEIHQALAQAYRTALGQDLGWRRTLCQESCTAAAAACDNEPLLGPTRCKKPAATCQAACQSKSPSLQWALPRP